MLWLTSLTVFLEEKNRAGKRGYIKICEARGGSPCEACHHHRSSSAAPPPQGGGDSPVLYITPISCHVCNTNITNLVHSHILFRTHPLAHLPNLRSQHTLSTRPLTMPPLLAPSPLYPPSPSSSLPSLNPPSLPLLIHPLDDTEHMWVPQCSLKRSWDKNIWGVVYATLLNMSPCQVTPLSSPFVLTLGQKYLGGGLCHLAQYVPLPGDPPVLSLCINPGTKISGGWSMPPCSICPPAR